MGLPFNMHVSHHGHRFPAHATVDGHIAKDGHRLTGDFAIDHHIAENGDNRAGLFVGSQVDVVIELHDFATAHHVRGNRIIFGRFVGWFGFGRGLLGRCVEAAQRRVVIGRFLRPQEGGDRQETQDDCAGQGWDRGFGFHCTCFKKEAVSGSATTGGRRWPPGPPKWRTPRRPRRDPRRARWNSRWG